MLVYYKVKYTATQVKVSQLHLNGSNKSVVVALVSINQCWYSARDKHDGRKGYTFTIEGAEPPTPLYSYPSTWFPPRNLWLLAFTSATTNGAWICSCSALLLSTWCLRSCEILLLCCYYYCGDCWYLYVLFPAGIIVCYLDTKRSNWRACESSQQ